ncbi:class I SAM-dependent methyltransferase [Catellatospora tritici]|uniref:class I SAM-dependent methyltransferase n=1 Tax=Catellatospora tritici TaxID=2851566 RepID=UPI001C2D75CA|nr:methyltransferase domain-containing protein [Catellatospora tritici]MBV1853068.1 methyltransferase domain-containing protein [Catellatospora tritici]
MPAARPSADHLLDDDALERSDVVANCAMNRERGLDGVNSYAKDLGLQPLDLLRSRIADQGHAAWLDLCCGAGRALAQAATLLRAPDDSAPNGSVSNGSAPNGSVPNGSVSIGSAPIGANGGGAAGPQVTLTGVDLVDWFDPAVRTSSDLDLHVASVATWQPNHAYDLITCAHGLHYVGDKLGVLARALTWLSPGGTLAVHLDLASIRLTDGTDLGRTLRRLLRESHVDYDARRRIVTCVGPRELDLPFAYAGADDRAGPNYTGQPAVDSYYRPLRTGRPSPPPPPPPRDAITVDDGGVSVWRGGQLFPVPWDELMSVTVSRFAHAEADIDEVELTVDLTWGEFATVSADTHGFTEAIEALSVLGGRPLPDLAALRPEDGHVVLWQRPSDT